jgi:hypothetical protein
MIPNHPLTDRQQDDAWANPTTGLLPRRKTVLSANKLSSRPERSEVEGPAVTLRPNRSSKKATASKFVIPTEA